MHIIYIFFLVVIIYYVIEVRLGSSVDVYNSEIGYASSCEEPTTISNKQFFCELLPVFICAIGVEFLFYLIF